uniref:Transmembrane protein n=1 Tax=Schistosoma mansoni TaxID=6183 RepID=A0A5K4F7G8_SCHMA
MYIRDGSWRLKLSGLSLNDTDKRDNTFLIYISTMAFTVVLLVVPESHTMHLNNKGCFNSIFTC